MKGYGYPSSPDGFFSSRTSTRGETVSGDPPATHPRSASACAVWGGGLYHLSALWKTVTAADREARPTSEGDTARGSARRGESGDPSPRGGLADVEAGPGFPLDEGRRARIITVSGSSKDVGKSSLAAFLVSHCSRCAAVKVSIHEKRPPGDPLVVEGEAPERPDTDTARLHAAGARPVLWLRSTPETLEGDVREAFSRLDARVIVVEGNSVLRYLEPDFAVFVMSAGFADFKPSAFKALEKAHTVVVNGLEDVAGSDALELERRIKELNPRAKLVMVSELGEERAWEVVLSRAAGILGGDLVSSEVEERILEAVREKAEEGRIPCAVALKLAEELGVPPLEVGKAANVLRIKIIKCSLGCF